MKQHLKERIGIYYRSALYARRRAEQETDPQNKANLLDLETHWLRLARTVDFAGQIIDYFESDPKRYPRRR